MGLRRLSACANALAVRPTYHLEVHRKQVRTVSQQLPEQSPQFSGGVLDPTTEQSTGEVDEERASDPADSADLLTVSTP